MTSTFHHFEVNWKISKERFLYFHVIKPAEKVLFKPEKNEDD